MHAEQTKLLRMMWAMFIGSIAVYGFLAYNHGMEKGTSFLWQVNDLKETRFLLIAALSIIPLVVAQILRHRANGQAFVIQLLQFILSEVPAILGLVLFFSEGTMTQMVTLCTASLVSFLSVFPKDTSLEPPQSPSV